MKKFISNLNDSGLLYTALSFIPIILVLLLIDSHEFWDAVFMENSDNSEQWNNRLARKYIDSNWYIPYLIMKGMLAIERMFSGTYRGIYLIILFLSMTQIYFLTFNIFKKHKFDKQSSALLAGFSITFPALHVVVSSVHILFIVSITAFTWAVFLLICTSRIKLTQSILIWILLVIGLQLQSLALLSFVAGIYGFWIFRNAKESRTIFFWVALSAFFLAPLAWRWVYLYHPPTGLYENYNRLTLSTIPNIPIHFLNTVYHYFSVFFSIGIATLIGIIKSRDEINSRKQIIVLVSCMTIFLCATMPYFLVDKDPSGPWNDWGDRNGLILLLAVPVIWGLLWYAFGKSKWFRFSAIFAFLIQVLLLSSLYVGWYFKSLEDEALFELLVQNPLIVDLPSDRNFALILHAEDNTFNRVYRDHELIEYYKMRTGKHTYVATAAEFLHRAKKQKLLFPKYGELLHLSIGGYNVDSIQNLGNCMTVYISVDELIDLRSLSSNFYYIFNKLAQPDWRQFSIVKIDTKCVDNSDSRKSGAWWP